MDLPAFVRSQRRGERRRQGRRSEKAPILESREAPVDYTALSM